MAIPTPTDQFDKIKVISAASASALDTAGNAQLATFNANAKITILSVTFFSEGANCVCAIHYGEEA